MKLKIFITLLIIALLTFIALSQIRTNSFAPAEDLPREALIYVQIADLPALIKLWNESKLNENYTASRNFEDFRNGHLGLKLASRWQEFDDAAGFPIDLETLAKLANNQAAIAVYDIGKLEFVFVAPVSQEVFAAAKFFQGKDKFTEETLEDGTILYHATVKADRGRQKQELIFTSVKGRFILATSEKLLMQTVNNINGTTKKNRLIDEPDFKTLSEKTAPHTATVWVDQAALNDDYYFKHYWLMSDVKELKSIRAGIFDFEMQEGKLLENRRFLLNENVSAPPISIARATEILTLLPENIPFYNLRKTNAGIINEAVKQIASARQITEKLNQRSHSSFVYEGYTSDDYGNLGEKFDNSTDEVNEGVTVEQPIFDNDFSTAFQTAAPQAVLTFTSPKVLPEPRFIEFRRAAIFNLSAPANFNRAAFETATAQNLAAQVLISSPGITLNWESKSENDISWREIDLPMTGQTINYTIRGDELILTDDRDFLREILTNKNTKSTDVAGKPFAELTVVNLTERENAFDGIFGKIDDETAANEFFTGNISSLLDAISEVERIEIRKSYSQNIFAEEVIFVLE